MIKGTITEKAGYQYSNGSSGKKWIRGRTMYSEGKKYTGKPYGDYIPCIVVTNLDTGEMRVATLAEAKRFLTEDGYKAYLLDNFKRLAENA